MRPEPVLPASLIFAPDERKLGAAIATMLWSASAAQLAALLIWMITPGAI